ncbi:MAG: Gfo/Idh/MocA family oxidoreductase [Gammaproteobacteria bacterium]|nr:Gfo/Idh/MocA family oxidoreductase [Gammaproteobacteria bacterium]
MKTKRIRIAVVGAGSMGERHARFLNDCDGVDLVGIVDSNFSKAEKLSLELGCMPYQFAEQVVGKIDAVTIATPPTFLAKTGSLFINAGIPPLIEKPVAVSLEEFNDLVNLSARLSVPFFVGLLESFSPAIKVAQEYLVNADIYSISCQRINPEGNRITDSDVLTDLLLHDLNNTVRFIKSEPICIDVYSSTLNKEKFAQHAISILRFADGRIAQFVSSRLFMTERRTFELSSSLGTIQIDLKNQIVQVFNLCEASSGVDKLNKRPSLCVETLPTRYENPLHNELKAYVNDIRNKKISNSIEGKSIAPLMKILWEAQRKLKQSQEKIWKSE